MSWTIEGKRVLLTGGTAGIGKATAAALAERGASVAVTARDDAKGRATAAEILATTGATIDVVPLDLASLDSVRACGERFAADEDRLDVLINNAGVIVEKGQTSADGHELTFAVNHLGPFLLTHLLTDLLVASAGAGDDGARIINVSSGAHHAATGRRAVAIEDLPVAGTRSSPRNYGASKLANILFTVELNRRLADDGVIARALHPGVVATNFGRGREGPWWLRLGMRVIGPLLTKPRDGAATSVHLATADGAELARGLYWEDCEPSAPDPSALDEDAAARLWALSENLSGLETTS